MSEINEKQLLLYAQMANLVNMILQWPDISIKEIAENFSKVIYQKLVNSVSNKLDFLELSSNLNRAGSA